jgi:hypothetical protein
MKLEIALSNFWVNHGEYCVDSVTRSLHLQRICSGGLGLGNRLVSVILSLFLGGLMPDRLFAQSAETFRPNIIPPSPEAAALGKFGDVPVDLYTGSPSISIPIWNLKSREIEVPINVSYHASGIKVDEVSSNVGLGWALSAGGLISRTVMGKVDGQAQFERVPFPEELIQDINNDGSYDFLPRYHTYGQAVVGGTTDTEPDIYSYNIGSKSGKFIFDHEGQIHLIPFENLRVSAETDRSKFYIIDEQGWKYTFEIGESLSTKSRLIMRGGLPPQLDYIPPPNVDDISAYRLKSIESVNHDKVDFYYQDFGFEYVGSRRETDYTLLPTQYCSPADLPLSEIWESTSFVSGSRITRIVADTGFSIDFAYQDQSRLDVKPSIGFSNSNSALQSISVKYQNNEIRNFVFDYDYFKTLEFETVPADQKALHCKLKLLSIKESEKPPYYFSYYENQRIVSRFSRAQDFWGYSNGKINTGTSLPRVFYDGMLIDGADRTPNFDFMVTCTLKAIKYPTGGESVFEFEPHDYASAFNVYDWPIPVTEGAAMSVSTNPNDPMVVTNVFTVPNNAKKCGGLNSTKVKVKFSSTNSNGSTFQSPDIFGFVSARINGPDNFSIVSAGNSNFEGCLTPGQYTAIASTGDLLDLAIYPNAIPASASIFVTWYESTNPSVTNNIPIGGLRIKRLIDKEGNSQVIKKYSYNLPGAALSSGVLANEPKVGYVKYSSKNHFVDNTNIIVTCPYYVRESLSSVPLGNIRGSNVAYQFVTVHEGENSEGGKEEYQFSSFSDLISPNDNPMVPSNNNSQIPNINYDWLRGLLLKKSVFAKLPGSAFAEIQREENYYKIFHNPFDLWAYRGGQNSPIQLNSDIAGGWNNFIDGSPFPISFIAPGFNSEKNILCMRLEKAVTFGSTFGSMELYEYNYYKYVTAHYELAKSINTRFDNAGNKFVNESRYYYDNNVHRKVTRLATDDTNGTVNLELRKYPPDYNNLQINSPDLYTRGLSMLASNNVSTVIESQNWKKEGTVFRPISASLTAFKQDGGNLVISDKLRIRNSIGLMNFKNSVVSSGNLFEFDSNYLNEFTILKNNSYGNILDYKILTGEQGSFIYGYNSTYPIAKIINATSDQVFHTSFEDGEGNSNDGDAKAGQKSKMDGFLRTLSNLVNGKYELSYWQKSGASWVFFKQDIDVTTGTFLISLNGQLDEIRFRPVQARMETYTYRPGLGMTSTCDANGVYSFYKYDIAGRLSAVLDHASRVVKTYAYAYSNK